MNSKEYDILCVDMDAFFVSIEQASNPLLKNHPVAVSGSGKRGVVVTSSYEARAKGVRTGMSVAEAKHICSDIIIINSLGRKYSYISSKIAEFLQTISPNSAMFSIDEAFLDITGSGFTSDVAAFMIKSYVKQNFGITCTVGVGCNKLIAKMATHVNKPDGYFKVNRNEALAFIDSFKLSDIWGIGKRSARKFAELGIFSAADIRIFGESNLEEMLGLYGKNIYRLVSGESETQIKDDSEQVKSFSHAMTFPKDICNEHIISAYILQLSEMVSSRARKHLYSGRTITLTVRTPEMKTFCFSHTLTFNTSATHHIYDCAMALYKSNWNNKSYIRLLGVSLSNLGRKGINYTNTDDILKSADKKNKLSETVDILNDKFGTRTLTYASVIKCKRKGSSVISPSWRPDGARNINIENN